ncbi:MAG: endonuclease NucS [Candidatus Thorarchaeota archaeon]
MTSTGKTLSKPRFSIDDKIWLHQSPSLEEASVLIQNAISQKRFILIIGVCFVEYQGRARSILTEGERLVLIKRDGTILVHKESGVEPLNWQPPGATMKVTYEEDTLILYANRAKPRETVRIEFSSLTMLSASLLDDPGEFSMHLTEDEMQKVLSTHPELIEPGLRTIGRERQVAPGFIDIFARDSDGRLVIIEVKRRRADSEAVHQLHGYLKSFQSEEGTDIRGILVAPSLTKGTFTLLEQLGLEYHKIEPQQCAAYLLQTSSHKLTDFIANSEPDKG